MSLARLLSRKDGGVPSLVTIIDRYNVAPEKIHLRRAVLTALKSFELAYKRGDYPQAEKWFRELTRRYEAPNSRRDFYIHPSELLYGCTRALVYKVSEVEPTDEVILKFDARTKRTFDVGTFYHRYIQDILKNAKEVHSFIDEVPIRNEVLKLRGSCDGRLAFTEDGEEFLLEIKTINSRGYAARMRSNEPMDTHLYQASIYAKELKVDKIIFLYINKDTSEMHTFLTGPKDYSAQQDEAYAKIAEINRYVKKGLEWPRICKTATEERALKCQYCSHCFKLK